MQLTAPTRSERRAHRADQPGRLLAVNLTACLVLLVQYLLGMAVNLFVVIPGHHPGARAANYFTGAVSGLTWIISHGAGWAAAHAALGLLLALAALASIVLAWRKDNRFLAATTVLGGLAVIGAGFNGMSFVNYGHNFSSMIMAGLWALAVACYVVGALLAARRLRQSG
jgi:type II secretory pathway component PulF